MLPTRISRECDIEHHKHWIRLVWLVFCGSICFDVLKLVSFFVIPWFSTPFSLLFEHPRGSEQGTPATPTSSTPEIQAWFWSGKPLLLALLFELALVFFLLKQRALVNFLSFAVIFFIKMAPTNQVSYHKDEKVLCFHHEILYEAKILDVRQTDPDDKKSPFEYAVHYKGWKSTYVLLLPPILWIHSFFRSLHVYYYDQCPPWVLDTLPYFDDHAWDSSFGIAPVFFISWNWEKSPFTRDNAHEQLLTRCASRWDDWVSTDRLRKFTDENRELATTLRREAESAFRQRNAKPTSKRRGGSDRSSARGSEERQLSVPGRGTKRGRDNEIEKVCFPFSFLLT